MKHKMHFSRLLRGSAALMLSLLMLLSTVTTSFAAQNEEKEPSAKLKTMLAEGKKSYPNGAFGILDTQISMKEGDDDRVITVVRMGKTDGEAKVDFCAADITSEYGVDYEL